MWMSFASSARRNMEEFDVGAGEVDWLSLIFLLMYLPGSVLAAYMTKLRTAIIFGAALQAFACLVRLAAVTLLVRKAAFSGLLLGQTLAALVQPLFTNNSPRIAAAWYEHTATPTTVALLFSCIGMACGQVLSPRLTVERLMAAEFTISMVLLALALLLVQSAPERPSSAAEMGRATALSQISPTGALSEQLAALFTRDRQYALLLVVFGNNVGSFNALLTCIDDVVALHGYNANDAGEFGGLLIIAGLISSILFGPMLDSTHAHGSLVKGLSWACVASAVYFASALRPGDSLALSAAFMALGASSTPCLPVFLDAAAEHAYPVSEDISGGMLMLVGRVAGIAYTFLVQHLVDLEFRHGRGGSAPSYAVVFLLTSLTIGAVAILPFHVHKRRTAAATGAI